ncbi:hypothetical protein RFI_04369 [Reticulomyxa filosa]|uniref:Transmembrane protein n=1 Tax=Reticulomyxa filosa TaxID=46433 RepID=X6P3P5_RETFI|nr:hypothetical protein RFI_04369 [Reticulomyxa filosa]|eukprot:ETO32748.1 hypothetical protein RFI_04369 [Reticulomyxa filosa]
MNKIFIITIFQVVLHKSSMQHEEIKLKKSLFENCVKFDDNIATKQKKKCEEAITNTAKDTKYYNDQKIYAKNNQKKNKKLFQFKLRFALKNLKIVQIFILISISGCPQIATYFLIKQIFN